MTPAPEPTTPTAENTTDRPSPWRSRLQGWVPVFGVATLALGLPLFRVLGPNPEFFLAHDVGPTGVVVFAVAAALVAPAILATVITAVGRWSPAARTALIAVVATVAVAGLFQALAGFALFPIVCLAAGVALAVAERESEALRSGLAVAAVVGLLAGGWFVGASRTSSYVFASGDDPIELVSSRDDLPPVVFLVFDEFPATALLNSDLEINAERFPNFARLAGESDWFWKASSVSPQTSASVPALWSGVEPSDAVAVSSNYPSNLFRELGGAYEVFAYEPITALCPSSVCGDSPVEQARPSTGFDDLLHDTAVVFGHAVGSDDIRDRLPAIDHSWSGFGATAVADGDLAPTEYAELGAETTFVGATAQLRLLVENRANDDRPPLYAAHLIAPHLPYMTTPGGGVYDAEDLAGMTTANGGLVWPQPPSDDADALADSEAYRRQGYQRLMLQLGALDRVLGDTISTLEAAGVWDDAAVVVTADHGASFEPGPFRDVGQGGAEVWNVPLFVKSPGQSEGHRRDESALTIDALPTLLGLLDLPQDSHFDGRDLNSSDVPEERSDAYVDGGNSYTLDQSEGAIAALVEHRGEWISPDGTWDEVFRAGPGGDLVGGPVPPQVSAVSSGTWSAGDSATLETFQRFDLSLAPEAAVPSGVLVAVDGTVVGAGAPVTASDSGYRVWTVVDTPGDVPIGRIALFAVGADGAISPLTTN